MKNILIIGTGGLAREFSSYFSDYFEDFNVVSFSSTNHTEHSDFNLPGKLFIGEITPDIVGTTDVVIAIANPSVKKRIAIKLKKLGFTFPAIIHRSSVVSDRAFIQDGVVISPNCVVSPNVILNEFSYLNFGVGVGHDAIIGKYVQINPGSQLGGFTQIGDESLVGSGSTILQGVKVGTKATIASGSVVFSEVSEGATMLGNPAKRMRAFEKE
ncbi:WbbJ Acetyltransferase (isoleucine patch superfamily) [Candidatus Pelagibacterales bacterium]